MASFKNQAKVINSFLNKITTAFLENSVPTGTPYPYITYSLSSEDFGEEGLIQVRIWTKSTSVLQVADLTDKLEELIGHEGITLNLEDGNIWLYKGSPFAQFVTDEDINIKSVYIVLNYRLYQL